MTTLSSSLSSSHRAQPAEYRHMGYLCNGWDKLRRWDGRSATLDLAGIAGPSRVLDSWTPAPSESAGDSTVGVHYVRYRYMESKTGFVSNPSEEREVEVTSTNGTLAFAIDISGATNILHSSDSKVDRVVVEMTTVGDNATFYKAAEGDVDASTIAVSIADPSLEVSYLPWADLGHAPPPVAKNVLSHRDRIWLYSQVTHSDGTATFTANSKNVVGASHNWAQSALGSSTVDPDAPWFIRKDGDTREYEIDYFDGTNTIVLVDDYAGTTEAGVEYLIFSRADVVWVSNPGYPEGFTPLKWLDAPNGERASEITAGVGYGSSVLFFSKYSMVRLTWDEGPLEDPVYIPVSSTLGALNQRVVIELDGTVFALSTRGISAWKGVSPSLVSQPLRDELDSVDWSLSERFHCAYHPKLRAIRWFVCYTGDTYPKHYFQLELESGAWSTGEYLQGISDSRLVPWENGTLEVLYGDENGHVWLADTGLADGCDETYSHPSVLGGTASVVVTSGGLPTPSPGLAGAYVYCPGLDESCLVTSSSEAVIAVSPSFSRALTSADTLWIGPIPSKLKTKAFGGRRTANKKRTGYLWIQTIPTASQRRLAVRVYEDLSGTAKTWATSRSNLDDTEWPGSNSDYPSSDWIALTDADGGAVQIPVGTEWRRHFELEFEILEPDADLELVGLEHDGTEILS